MTPRSIRRAIERKQMKEARKAERRAANQPVTASVPEPGYPELDSTEIESVPNEPHFLSDAQLTANRLNAQFSTGPRSAQGKAKSSLNAVKTALTGRTVLLPSDDAAEYERHLREYESDMQPVGPRECAVVQSLADTDWRLHRIPALEMAIYAHGRVQFADRFDNHDAATRPGLIDLHTFLTSRNSFAICNYRKRASTAAGKRTWPNSASSRKKETRRKPGTSTPLRSSIWQPNTTANRSIRPTVGSNFQWTISKPISKASAPLTSPAQP